MLYLEELVDEDSTLVMGSDGLWDVLNNEDVYEFIKKVNLFIFYKKKLFLKHFFKKNSGCENGA